MLGTFVFVLFSCCFGSCRSASSPLYITIGDMGVLKTAACICSMGVLVATESPEDRILSTFKHKLDFLWGTATAAYQVEGAWDKDGRQNSIWDVFSHSPGHVYHNDNGNVADDFYDLYPKDVQRISEYGFNAFRLSISWPRIYPKGEDGVHSANPAGVRFYKELLFQLSAKGITALVTIFHWDLPDDLDWLSDSVVDAYVEYAGFLFKTFPEVKHWLTFNEPWSFCGQGYNTGNSAPGVVSSYKHYICGHNVLRAHAKAVALYRTTYKAAAHGKIGITLNYDFAFPWNPSITKDQAAAQMHRDFNLGWFADPIYLQGDYPKSMRERLGRNLPEFTEDERQALQGSSDFYGLNTYSATYAKAFHGYFIETRVGMDGQLIGQVADSPWLYVVPRGIRAHLEYVNDRYKPVEIVVTENGCDVPGENDMPLQAALNDTFRVNYYRDYLDNVSAAVREAHVPLTGYFAWSLLDNFEWADGYRRRFGITYVNYTTQERHAKNSAIEVAANALARDANPAEALVVSAMSSAASQSQLTLDELDMFSPRTPVQSDDSEITSPLKLPSSGTSSQPFVKRRNVHDDITVVVVQLDDDWHPCSLSQTKVLPSKL